MSFKRSLVISILIIISLAVFYIGFRAYDVFYKFEWGEKVDALDGVHVYYNGAVSTTKDRHIIDSYNVGLKYQCVEFVKRYYLLHYNHKMPNTYGHAKDFFQIGLIDGAINKARDLHQYTNPSKVMPKKGDLIVMGAGVEQYGHVAIISKVESDEVEIIQQNPGVYGHSRVTFEMDTINGLYKIKNSRINGWLRK